MNEYDLIRRSLNTLSKHSRDMENQYKIAEPFLQEALIQKILTGTYSEGEWDAVRQLDLCRFPFHCVILVKLDSLLSACRRFRKKDGGYFDLRH